MTWLNHAHVPANLTAGLRHEIGQSWVWKLVRSALHLSVPALRWVVSSVGRAGDS